MAVGDWVVVRTADGLYELAGGRFVASSYRHGPPRSAAVFDHAIWVSDGAGLYRLTAAANDAIPAPLAGGRLTTLGDRLALWGDGGVWTRGGGADEPWRELARGGGEVHPTGDLRYPALLVGGDGAFLAEPAAGRLHPVALPVPARDVAAALLADGRLAVGTSGYGLLLAEIAASPAATSDPPVATAGAASSVSATAAGPSSSR